MNPLLRWVNKIIGFFRPAPASVPAADVPVSKPVANVPPRKDEPLAALPLQKEIKVERPVPTVEVEVVRSTPQVALKEKPVSEVPKTVSPKVEEPLAPVKKEEPKIEPVVPAPTPVIVKEEASKPIEVVAPKAQENVPPVKKVEEKPEKKAPAQPQEVVVEKKKEPAPASKPEVKPLFTGRVELTPALDNPARLRQIKGVISVNDIANRELLDLVPYEPGKPVDDVARELGLDPASIIKLASNENPLGPSPLAMAAMHKAIETSHFYPDGGGFHLRNAIAHTFGLGRENVVLGNGSNEIIELLFHTFTRPGIHEIITAKHAFAVYTLMAQLFGVHAIEVDDVDFTPDLPAMLKAVTPQTRLIFLASPNNPTGTRVTNEALDAFIRELPPHVIAVLDEAYYEFLDNPPDTVGYVKSGERVVLMRTFSKIQGLAGLRVGYGLAAAEIANLLQRARQPFNANLIAQAGAMAGLADVEHQKKTKAITDEGRKLMEETFAKMGLKYVPSAANFVMVNVGDGGEVFKRLMKKGIIVRSMVSYHLPAYIRVSVGTPEQNARFFAELPGALEGLVSFTRP
jgi:histidinol-phosphate aminotransferase